MKYFVVDNLEEIKTLDQDSLKERIDIECIHDFKFISDKIWESFSNYEIDCDLKLILGNEYHVVYVVHDINDGVTNQSNLVSVVGIYSDIVFTNKIMSVIKHDIRNNPDKIVDLYLDDLTIDTTDWKNKFSIPKKVESITLKFKHGENYEKH